MAEDSVIIKTFPGRPPFCHQEHIQLVVSRFESPQKGHESQVDKYFERVKKTLLDAQVPSDWFDVGFDTPYIGIEISIGGKKYTLHSSGCNRAISGAEAAKNRVCSAFKTLIQLTTDQTKKEILGK